MMRKWDFASKKYHNYEPAWPEPPLYLPMPEGLKVEVNCASCGSLLTYGDCYTSKQIHDAIGFGYPVCEECYEQEIVLERKYKQ